MIKNMKKTTIIWLAFFILIPLFGCKEDSTTKVVQNNIPFTSYDAYYIDTAFVSNNYLPFYTLDSFLLFQEYKDLEGIFLPKILTPPLWVDSVYNFIKVEDFESNYAVAILKKVESRKYKLKINEIFLTDSAINFKYTYQYDDNFNLIGDCNYALATFEKSNFNKLQFYQNDTLVKTIILH